MTAAAMATTATVEAARTTRRLYPRRVETNAGRADRSVGRTSRSVVRPPLQRANALRPLYGTKADGWSAMLSGRSGLRRIGGWMAGFLFRLERTHGRS
jgi:hypothetical protein